MRLLADALIAQKRYAEADQLLREGLEDSRKNSPAGHQDIAISLANLAQLQLLRENFAEAESLLREALAILSSDRPNGERTLQAKYSLGETLLGQKKFAEAESLLLDDYPLVLERVIARYAKLHTAEPDQGHDAKAAEWHKKLDDFKAAKPK